MRDTEWLLVHVDAAVSILRTHPRTTRQDLERRLLLSRPEMDEIVMRLWRMGAIKSPLA